MNIEEKVDILIRKKVEKLGYELYDVEYAKEGTNYFLRVFIDKPDGIGLNDCEKVNNEIVEDLDEVDYIKEQYFLEVSSTGVEKTLKKDSHLTKFIGKEVFVKLFKKNSENQKEFVAILEGFDEKNIKLIKEEQLMELQRKEISQIKSIYNW